MRESTPSSSSGSEPLGTGRPQPQLKPVIADLLRTRYCIQSSVLLIEALDFALTGGDASRATESEDAVAHAAGRHTPPPATTVAETQWRALRLVLGDGDLAIQALLHPDLHRLADSGTVRVGAYVSMTRFEARWRKQTTTTARRRSGSDGGSSNGGSEMVYLVVFQLDVVGYDEEFAVEEALRARGEAAETEADSPAKQEAEADVEVGGDVSEQQHNTAAAETTATTTRSTAVPARTGAEDMEDLEDMIDTDDDDFETMEIDEQRAAARRDAASRLEETYRQQSQRRASLPWRASSADPSKPVRLTPLRAIPTLPYAQNWIVNVLAVVASLSAVEPAQLRGYTSQRVARLADPTTNKLVHLTVFLDPEGFRPAVGSVVLLIGVKNHRFDGGSLKKYGNGNGNVNGGSRSEDGGTWWLENPFDLQWCDTSALRDWWTRRAGVGCQFLRGNLC